MWESARDVLHSGAKGEPTSGSLACFLSETKSTLSVASGTLSKRILHHGRSHLSSVHLQPPKMHPA